MRELQGLVCLALLASACGAPAGAPADAAVTPDAAAPDAAAFGFVPSNVPMGAVPGEPLEDLVIGPGTCDGRSEITIDTDERRLADCPALLDGVHYRFVEITQRQGGTAALLVTRSGQIEAGMRVSVRGKLPLVWLARDRIDIGGALGASALGFAAPAGGSPPRPPTKGSGNGPGAGAGDGPGGGGGGSYCGPGGKGGPSSSGGANAGGPRYGNTEIVPLAGGSSGGNGGNWEAGAGGGALQIVAGRRVAVLPTGVVHAGGGGGEREGGGGGSGGAILLEAPTVIVGGILAANGGGGGSGGEAGTDATPDDRAAAGGGAVHLNLGEGGSGAAGAIVDGGEGRSNPDFVNGDFSGGGGGCAGYLRINGEAIVTGTLSPALGTPCASIGTLGQR